MPAADPRDCTNDTRLDDELQRFFGFGKFLEDVFSS
jgi:hypothetical protein